MTDLVQKKRKEKENDLAVFCYEIEAFTEVWLLCEDSWNIWYNDSKSHLSDKLNT